MKVLLTTLNAKYIHTNLALRWLYVARDDSFDVAIKEYTINDKIDEIAQEICLINPDIIGLSVYIWNQEESKKLVLAIHKYNPTIRILVGGPEVSFEYADWLNYPIEGVLRGEGEKTFWQACRSESSIDGFASIHYVSPIPYAKVSLEWLETLESPYFLDFDKENQKNRYLYMETSRGCPYQCSYCLSSLDNQVRLFSEDYVLAQLNKLKKDTCKQVKFLDRTFNVKPKRALNIASFINQLEVPYSFQFEVVLDTMPEDMLIFFENSNKEKFRFEVGVQSFNIDTLKSVHRFQNQDILVQNIKRLSKSGCSMHVDLIGGLPYEDLQSFTYSYTKLFACGASEIQVGLLKLLKGTSLKRQAELYGFVCENNPPYTIIKTNWLSENDVKIIERVYHATEKLYNNGRMRTTLDTCFQWGFPIFEVLSKVGIQMKQFQGQVQIRDYFLMTFDVLKSMNLQNEGVLKALLNTDYYRLFKQNPKPLFYDEVSIDTVKKIFKHLTLNKNFDEQNLYNYGKIRIGFYQDEILYQLLLYDHQQNYPKRTWITLEGELR